MYRHLTWLSVFLVFAVQAAARDSREMRRLYTKTLRSHLVAIDRGLSESQKGGISAERKKELQEGYEILKEKLSKNKREEMESILKNLAPPQSDVTRSEKLLRRYRQLSLEAFRVVTVPTEVPSVRLGAEVYKENCESCHGNSGKGDGKLARNTRFPMVPPPTNLADLAASGTRSAFSYYNLLIIGLPNSIMPTYDVTLTDQERWSLAFFLMGQPFSDGKLDTWEPEKFWAGLTPQEQSALRKTGGSLAELAQKSDAELSAALEAVQPQETAERRRRLIVALRRGLAYLSDTPRSRSSM